MARINNNVSSLIAVHQLTKNERMMNVSLEKLSSGFRINHAADDPAGLVLSEQLRSQIVGLDQASKNTQDATSLIQTAEGSMQEMQNLLKDLRALALHAKNTGVADATAVAADQTQVDEAITALDKIARNTFFGGRNLLDGTASHQSAVISATVVASVQVGNTAAAGTNAVAIGVTTAATRAIKAGTVDRSAALGANAVINVNGYNINLTAGQTQAQVVSALNAGFTTYGLDMTAVANGVNIDVRHNQYGSAYNVVLTDASGVIVAAGSSKVVGVDIAGTINSQVATGLGLTLKASAGTAYEGTQVTVTSAGNAVATTANAFSVTKAGLTFQVGSAANDYIDLSMVDMTASKLGTVAGGATGLLSIKTGGSYALATAPGTALSVIDEAIDTISTQRAKLGAIQRYTLQSKLNSLDVSKENVTAAESRVRDVDMAAEMSTFTKNQVLVQSATAMLAQANAAPQSVLSLLKG